MEGIKVIMTFFSLLERNRLFVITYNEFEFMEGIKVHIFFMRFSNKMQNNMQNVTM
jgi:hypothetical protein